MTRLFSIVLSVCLIASTASWGAATHVVQSNLQIRINGYPVELDSPIVKKEDALFFPIQDVLNAMNAKLVYQRRDDIYKLILVKPEVSAVLVPNSREFIVNQDGHFFANPTFFYFNRLYVPLYDFFQILNWDIDVQRNIIYLTQKPAKAAVEQPRPVITKTTFRPNVDENLADLLDPERPSQINFGKYSIDLTPYLQTRKKGVYIDVAGLLQNSQFEVIKSPNQVRFIHADGIQINLPLQGRQATILANGKSSTRLLAADPIMEDGRLLVPLSALESVFDYAIDWNPKNRMLRMLNKIKGAAFYEKNGQYRLEINTSYKAGAQITTLENPSRIQVTVPFCMPQIQESNLKIGRGGFDSIQFTYTNFGTKITIQAPGGFQANVKQSATGIDMTFSPESNVAKVSSVKGSIPVLPIQKDLPESPESNWTWTPKTSKELKDQIIVLDAGHGGNDPGAVNAKGEQEKLWTRDITDRLIDLLKKTGATVIEVREADQNPSLSARAAGSDQAKADIFLSIHINSFYKEHANGTETYYYKPQDKKLAQCLQEAMVKTLQLKDNGVKQSRLYVLAHSKSPAALVEPAFITNENDNQHLRDETFRQKIAQSLLDGITHYLNK